MDKERSKWATRLQPIKELAKNFNIDIAAELEQYLDEVEQCLQDDQAEVKPSFEEAALVVQSSSYAYAKKVDYLMKLAVAALEGAKAKQKQSDQSKKAKVCFQIVFYAVRSVGCDEGCPLAAPAVG